MEPPAAPWDNGCMNRLDATGSAELARTDEGSDRGTPAWVHRTAVILGWTAAWTMVALGLLVGRIALQLANCKLGFFGEYGPLVDAPGIDSADLVGQLIAWVIATLPWWIVMIWPRRPERRRQAAAVIGIVTIGLVTLFLVPQMGRDMDEWWSICGGAR